VLASGSLIPRPQLRVCLQKCVLGARCVQGVCVKPVACTGCGASCASFTVGNNGICTANNTCVAKTNLIPVCPHAGVCPVHTGIGPCLISCANDTQCQPGYKCCGVGCGRTCVKACPTLACLVGGCVSPYMLKNQSMVGGCATCPKCVLTPPPTTPCTTDTLCVNGWCYEGRTCVPLMQAGQPCDNTTVPPRQCAAGLNCNMTANVPAGGICTDPCGTCPVLTCAYYNQEPDPSIIRPKGCSPCRKCCGNCYTGPT